MIHEHSAGGVVYSSRGGGRQVLLIKDRYGRWTLPKGGIEQGETPEIAALREIEEETGIKGEIEKPVGSTRYRYASAQGEVVHKTVDYFLVRALTLDITPATGEIEEAAWVPVEDVVQREGYANNTRVIMTAIEMLAAWKELE